jgi:hypothetical protein
MKTDDFPCKTRQVRVGVVPADGLGCLHTTNFFSVFIKCGSLSMSAYD